MSKHAHTKYFQLIMTLLLILSPQFVPVTNMFTSLNMADVDIQDGDPQSLIFTSSKVDDSGLRVCDVTRANYFAIGDAFCGGI